MVAQTPFEHRYSAHCESGVVSSLLRHHGLDISEAMAFGLSSSLSFAYLPFIKLGGLPLIAYRMPPKSIIKGVQKQLGLSFRFETFRDADRGMQRLDELLGRSQVVGAQSSVYWLPYFPKDMRFHFNAHNMLIYGKNEDDYLISDPVFEEPVTCPGDALKKARFVKGVLAPKGLIYYPQKIPAQLMLRPAIARAIKKNINIMLKTPLPFIGVKGIHYLARQIDKLHHGAASHGPLYIGHIVRMQEEIGTGGAGFRFIYASFLQEAAKILENDELHRCAEQMTGVGDHWRVFALQAARMCKGRQAMDYAALSGLLHDCGRHELAFYQALQRVRI